MPDPISPTASKIFISHAWEDKTFVRRLEMELKTAGAEVWVDHSGVQGGDNLPKRISDALAWCDTILLVWSQAASQSHWVELEWTNALSLRKTIIPCLVDKTPLPALLANVLYVDCRDFEKGFTQLRQALHLDQPTTKSEPIPTSTTKDRRIDAAVPSAAELGRAIDLRVQVRFPDSPRLGLEDWPAKNKPAQLEQAVENVTLEFPVDATGKLGSARLEIRVVAPDFDIAGNAKQILLVPPEALSKCLSFLITPKRTGFCRLNVEVYNVEQIFLGAIPIETEVGGEMKAPATNIANLFLFVTVGQEKAATRSGTQKNTKTAERPPVFDYDDDFFAQPPAPAPKQPASEVNIGGGRDTTIGGDVVGRDKIIFNPPAKKEKKSWIETTQAKLTLVATILGIIATIFTLKDSLIKTAPSSRFQTKVIDKDSKTGIGGVTVQLKEIDGRQADQTVKTSSDGSFVIKVAAEAGIKIRLSFVHPEYQPYDDYYETENPQIIHLTRRAK